MSNRRIQCISGFLTALCTDFEDVSILDVGSGQMATAKLIVDACSSVKFTCIDPEELPPNADHIKKRSKSSAMSKRFEDVVKYDVMQVRTILLSST
jgi:hypothetical protein